MFCFSLMVYSFICECYDGDSLCMSDGKGHNLSSSSQRSSSFPLRAPSPLIRSSAATTLYQNKISQTPWQSITKSNSHLFYQNQKTNKCQCAHVPSHHLNTLFTLLPGGLVKRSCAFRDIITKETGSSLCSNFSHVSHFLKSNLYGLL